MDTCGHPTRAVPSWSDGVRRLLPSLVCTGLLAGCAMTMESGRPPPVERLSQLRPGGSSRDEVLRVLGPPQGAGASRMPGLPLQDLLVYDYEASDGKKVRMMLLAVFVSKDTGIYQGYMWFGSGLLVNRARRE